MLPLGSTVEGSTADEAMQKKIHGVGIPTLTWNEEMKDLLKIVKSSEESVLLIKDIRKLIENQKNEQNAGFCSMVLVIVSAILLGNLLGGKGIFQDCEETVAAQQEFWCRLILWLILEYKTNIKRNPNLMVLIEEKFFKK